MAVLADLEMSEALADHLYRFAYVCLWLKNTLISLTIKLDRMKEHEPFDETPAPISMSGSSTTSPLSIGLPPVPPYSAVSIHLRSASVRRSMGIMLMPV